MVTGHFLHLLLIKWVTHSFQRIANGYLQLFGSSVRVVSMQLVFQMADLVLKKRNLFFGEIGFGVAVHSVDRYAG